jgi:hypothetical protein
MALLAMAPWTLRGLQYMVVVSLMLVVVYYPNGEDGLYNWGYLGACLAAAVLAAWSLERPDPLKLAAGARRKPAPEPAATSTSNTAALSTEPTIVATPQASTAASQADPADSTTAPADIAPSATPAPAGAEQRAG